MRSRRSEIATKTAVLQFFPYRFRRSSESKVTLPAVHITQGDGYIRSIPSSGLLTPLPTCPILHSHTHNGKLIINSIWAGGFLSIPLTRLLACPFDRRRGRIQKTKQNNITTEEIQQRFVVAYIKKKRFRARRQRRTHTNFYFPSLIPSAFPAGFARRTHRGNPVSVNNCTPAMAYTL